MAWWDGPDPYTYEKLPADIPGQGRRRAYLVRRGGFPLGVIAPRTDHWNRKAGRLIVASGSRPAFAAVVPARHSFTGELLGNGLMIGYDIERDRRRDAADDLVRHAKHGADYTAEFIVHAVGYFGGKLCG